MKQIRIALIGQPNCGKSTLFNQIAGYRSLTANFPGATVTYIKGKTYIGNDLVEIVDLPGTYSLSWYDDAEKEAVKALFSMDIDVIVNIVDASTLIRSIEMTLELMCLGKPMVMALNMMDEAERKGIIIDTKKLSDALGIKVVPIIAKKGKGVKELLQTLKNASPPTKECIYSEEIESKIENLEQCIGENIKDKNWPVKMMAIKSIEGFKPISDMIENTPCRDELIKARKSLDNGNEIEKERHALCMDIFEDTSKLKKIRTKNSEEKIDSILMHPVLGYLVMFVLFLGVFYIVFQGGTPVENIFIDIFDKIDAFLVSAIPNKLVFSITKGAVDGIGAAIGIALPYLVPFLFIISFFEDVGYLPRVAYLMDSVLHKMGVHGTSVISFVVGYGCSVPAVMATRILKSKKEKIIAAFLASLVPCSARSTVIMGLVGYFLGYMYVIPLYMFNLVVIVISGMILKRLLPGISPEMVLDIPPYRIPSLKTVILKTWLKIKDFVYVAVPLLVAGSVLLAVISYYHLDDYINMAFEPLLSGVLGLPSAVGVVLIFGVFRKELTLLMLYQALGLSSAALVNTVMSTQQMLVFTIFVMFYIPCVATIAVLKREVGLKYSLYITIGTFVLAVILSYFVKIIISII